MCVCIRVCVYVCVCVYVYMRVYVYVCMCVCMYACVYMCAYVCVYVYMCVYMCICICVYVCVCICVYMYMCVCMCVCTNVCMYTYRYTSRAALWGELQSTGLKELNTPEHYLAFIKSSRQASSVDVVFVPRVSTIMRCCLIYNKVRKHKLSFCHPSYHLAQYFLSWCQQVLN